MACSAVRMIFQGFFLTPASDVSLSCSAGDFEEENSKDVGGARKDGGKIARKRRNMKAKDRCGKTRKRGGERVGQEKREGRDGGQKRRDGGDRE